MDEDLLGVLIVLGILGVGGVGAVILLILYAEPVRKFLRFRKNDEEEEGDVETPTTRKKSIKRTHIVVSQGKNVFEIDEVNKSVRKVTAPARKLTVAVHPMPTGSTSMPSSPLKKDAPINLGDLEHNKVERTLSAPAYEAMDGASSVSGSAADGVLSRKGILRRPLVVQTQSQSNTPRKATVLIINEGNRYRKITSNTPSLPNSPEMESNYLPGYRPPSDRRSSCS